MTERVKLRSGEREREKKKQAGVIESCLFIYPPPLLVCKLTLQSTIKTRIRAPNNPLNGHSILKTVSVFKLSPSLPRFCLNRDAVAAINIVAVDASCMAHGLTFLHTFIH